MNKFWVSRQSYLFADEPLVVEIAIGGLDYANADMFSDSNGNAYHALGSCAEYTDPREALEAAFAIRDAWIKNLPSHADCKPRIEVGYTGGNTIPFEDYPDDDELRKWAEDRFAKLPKCDHCGDIIVKEWKLGNLDDCVFCSQCCAEEAYRFYMKEMEDNDD